MTLLNDVDQRELHHQQMITLCRLRGATSNHTDACGCSMCRAKRDLEKALEEPSDAERFSLMVEKEQRRLDGWGGGA